MAILDGRVAPLPLLIGLLAAMLAVAWLIHAYVERPVARLAKPALSRAIADLKRDDSGRGAGPGNGSWRPGPLPVISRRG